MSKILEFCVILVGLCLVLILILSGIEVGEWWASHFTKEDNKQMLAVSIVLVGTALILTIIY